MILPPLVFPGKGVNVTLLGSAKAIGREPESCLGQVFNFKFGCLCYECDCMTYTWTLTSRVENSAQTLSCLSNLVIGLTEQRERAIVRTERERGEVRKKMKRDEESDKENRVRECATKTT